MSPEKIFRPRSRSSFLRDPLIHPQITMRPCHTLIQDGTAVTADEVSEAVTKQAMVFECDQGIAVLPAFADVFRSAVLALCDRWLGSHSLFPFL